MVVAEQCNQSVSDHNSDLLVVVLVLPITNERFHQNYDPIVFKVPMYVTSELCRRIHRY
jgi:hypothetical protein